MALVSVIIVTWNNENDIEECLRSVMRNAERRETEIICIDNNSADETYERAKRINFQRMQFSRNETNEGFTRAVNRGISYSKGDHIFLLNPDTVLEDDCIEILSRFLSDNEEYSACCPKLLNEDRRVQYSVRNFPDYLSMFSELSLLSALFPKSKLFGKWKMKYFDYAADSDVNQPMAAALMVRKSAGVMDERFEMFFNDVDLCKRIIGNGGKIRYLSGAAAVHKMGASVYRDRIRMIKTWDRDCVKYFEKHHNNAILVLWLRISLKISEIIRILYYKVKGLKLKKLQR